MLPKAELSTTAVMTARQNTDGTMDADMDLAVGAEVANAVTVVGRGMM
jgi:hypothetical protein